MICSVYSSFFYIPYKNKHEMDGGIILLGPTTNTQAVACLQLGGSYIFRLKLTCGTDRRTALVLKISLSTTVAQTVNKSSRSIFGSTY